MSWGPQERIVGGTMDRVWQLSGHSCDRLGLRCPLTAPRASRAMTSTSVYNAVIPKEGSATALPGSVWKCVCMCAREALSGRGPRM